MADVAGTALGTAMEPAVRDDPGADARADLDHDDVVVAGGDPRAPLTEPQDVDVVVDPHGGPVALGEALPDRVAVPAGHDRRRDRPARPELDRPRYRDPDAPQPAGDRLGGRAERLEQRLDPLQARLRAGLDPGRLLVVAKDPPVERGQRDVDAGSSEIRHEDVARPRPGTRADAAAGHRSRAHVALHDEASVDELADPLGDDRPAEAGPVDELGAGARAHQADLVEHHDQGVEGLVGQGRPLAGPRVERSTFGESVRASVTPG